MPAERKAADTGSVTFERGADSSLIVHLSGSWRMRHGLPTGDLLNRELMRTGDLRRVVFEASDLGDWDSGLLVFVARAVETCKARKIDTDISGLPAGVKRMIDLAEAVPENKEAETKVDTGPFVERIGRATINYLDGLDEFVAFLGALAIAFGRLFTGQARFRRIDLMIEIQDCGARAFGIVTLISFLVGVILAFMGAVQLQQFGASIYVADLVAIGMVRDMGAMMTAIIMAGRTGAAFAAQLGSMKVTQEIDALTTMGLAPMEFLVLPRVLALVLMMPLLCVYSDMLGILGGAAVGAGMLNISLGSYMRETIAAIELGGVFGGIFKATVYGAIIGTAGCLRGFQCGSSSSAVGDAATSAVVTGIVYVVVACGVFAVLFNILGI
ncbi:MAG: ABC transporter permease [Candidatus Binataceae bacterium]|jgi:phospholipid/cholesterol/gamma-HCH transport system permease protein